MKRTKISDIFASPALDTTVDVMGWVRTRRGNKYVQFVALNDGSTIRNLQIVFDMNRFSDEQLKAVTTGSSIHVKGTLVASQGKGQSVEVQAEELTVFGTADETYPLQKKGHTLEFLREKAHLRPRTNTFGAVLRVRSALAFAIHKFFQEKGFFYLNTPLITASDCEGAGAMFQVTTLPLGSLPMTEDGKPDYSRDFFGKPTALTVSGQLEGELGATALGAIYTFGPTFRAENSNTPRHLSEFWMIEPEMAFYDIADNMDLAEEFVKYCIRYALDTCRDDIEFLAEHYDKALIERLEGVLAQDFVRLTYTEGVEILEKSGRKFERTCATPTGLKFCVVGCSREWYYIADVGHAGDEQHEAFETETETAVRHGAEAARVEIPPHVLHRYAEFLDASEEFVVVGFALRAAYDFADVREQHVHGAHGAAVGVLLHVEVRDVIPFPRTPNNAEF